MTDALPSVDAIPPSAPPEPHRAFVAAATDRPGPLVRLEQFEGASFSRNDPSWVLAGTPAADIRFPDLQAYMQRRFGPGFVSGDPDDVSAGWRLTTPDPDLYLEVKPSPVGPDHALIPMIPWSAMPRGPMPPERLASFVSAYRAACLDLLRPVPVQGVMIDARGIAPDQSHGDAAETYSACGRPIPRGMVESPDFPALLWLVQLLGKEDVREGLRLAVERLREGVVERVEEIPEETRLLVLARALSDDPASALAPALSRGLTQAEVARARDLSVILSGGNPDATPAFSIEAAEEASLVATSLGLSPHVARPLHEHRKATLVGSTHAALRRLARGEVPDAAIPRIEGLGIPSAADVEAFVASLRAHGKAEAADHLAAVLAEPDGPYAVHRVVWHLAARAERERKATAATATAP